MDLLSLPVGWLPADLGGSALFVLLAASFLGSLMTSALGVGGGAFLLLVMAEFITPLALIPLHGLVQLGSNVNRVFHTRRYIKKSIILPFSIGALVSCIFAVGLIGQLDIDWIPLLVAAFILWLCWGPMPGASFVQSPWMVGAGGFVTTMATMVFGATGPLVAAWLGRDIGDRWTYTACFSACMSLQHLLKIVVFGMLGFSFGPWALLAILMIVSGYIGTRAGLHLLHKLPERRFQQVFKFVLTALALRVLWNWWTAA